MKRANFIMVLVVIAVAASLSSPAWAQRPCMPTLNNCPNQNVTTSKIQIGGAGSLSSAGASFSNPGRLDDGTIAEADLDFSFDRVTGRLTVVATNRTTTVASLTAFGFNTTSDVTGMSLFSHTGTLNWEMAFDRDRTDNVVDSHPSLNPGELKMDGFGRFNVFFGNKGISTGGNGGNKNEILAGNSVTYVITVSGTISNITACSFTSVGSFIPPGDKIVTAVGRFQAGVNGGSAFIGPCTGGPLLISLSSFSISSRDPVTVEWLTASEIDNAGFAVLREDMRSRPHQIVRLNETLIAAQGSDVSGAAYSFTDPTAVNGRKYKYMLEDWDLSGFNTIHLPEVAVPNPKNPPIRLLSPGYEDRAGAAQKFRWESDGRVRSTLEVSADAQFPAGSTLKIRVGARTSRQLTFMETAQVRNMAAAGEGGVYWRVTGRDAQGAAAVSQTFFLVVP